MTAAMPDLTSVADELYGLDPADFIGARDQHAAAARTARSPGLARAIARLRKPTLAAWASNLLVREQPAEADALQRLGEALRTAQAELAGEQLRELNRQRNAVVRKLAGAAADLAAAAGHPLAEAARQEVDATLHAVLADADAAREWAAGHLEKPLTPATGFTPGAAPARRPASTSKAPARTAAATRGSNARRDKLRRQLDKARTTAADARERADRLEQEHDAALQRRQQAVDRLTAAQDDVAALARQLDDARAAEKDAHAQEAAARKEVRAAAKAADAARRDAQSAQDAVERLDAELGRDPS